MSCPGDQWLSDQSGFDFVPDPFRDLGFKYDDNDKFGAQLHGMEDSIRGVYWRGKSCPPETERLDMGSRSLTRIQRDSEWNAWPSLLIKIFAVVSTRLLVPKNDILRGAGIRATSD